jgi:hypothetical protein
MLTLSQIYEDHAKECFRSAAREDDLEHRNLMLKLATAWREDAEALTRRGTAHARKCVAKGESIEACCGRRAERCSTCACPAAA